MDTTNNDIFDMDIDALLYGNPNQTDQQNKDTFELIHLYIAKTNASNKYFTSQINKCIPDSPCTHNTMYV